MPASEMGALGCIVFDLDDTLYLERDYVRSGFEAVGVWVRDEFELEGFAKHAWTAFEAGVRGQVFDAALRSCGLPVTKETVASLVACYREHAPVITLLDDARACLKRLSGCALAVVTDGPVASQRAKAQALNVDGWAKLAVFTGELGQGFSKPHCRAFELVETGTSYRGSQCAYLADNPAKDFAGPRSLGWLTVRVRRAGGLHREVPSGADVDVELTDLSAVPSCLVGR